MRTQRPRREVSPGLTTVLRPLFRYSYSRDAYVLRGIGGKHGPVLRPRRASGGTDRPAGV
jgi:hypothetical protein